MARKQPKKPWHEALFDRFYYEFAFEKMEPSRTQKQVDFVEDAIGLKGRERILDLCCGPGRHSIELARRGYDVVGLDRSAFFLQKAREKARDAKIDIRFRKGDMRRIPYRDEFDVVINMFTSFGYFEKESDNRKVIEGVARALRPGGRFLIDVMNRDFLVKHFRTRNWEEANGWVRLESVRMDWQQSRVTSEWVFIKGGRRRKIDLNLRVYSPHELIALLASAGLKVEKTFGGFAKEPLSPDANRLIVVARR
ncbi:MAG: methyltransferase domain-containing protein [Planctomycetota bacterium]